MIKGALQKNNERKKSEEQKKWPEVGEDHVHASADKSHMILVVLYSSPMFPSARARAVPSLFMLYPRLLCITRCAVHYARKPGEREGETRACSAYEFLLVQLPRLHAKFCLETA